jgi:hypothetical protein
MRLVRAGDAGGATRRPASFAELTEPARAVARKLATKECSRPLVVREPMAGPDGAAVTEDAFTVELAHEQLDASKNLAVASSWSRRMAG